MSGRPSSMPGCQTGRTGRCGDTCSKGIFIGFERCCCHRLMGVRPGARQRTGPARRRRQSQLGKRYSPPSRIGNRRACERSASVAARAGSSRSHRLARQSVGDQCRSHQDEPASALSWSQPCHGRGRGVRRLWRALSAEGLKTGSDKAGPESHTGGKHEHRWRDAERCHQSQRKRNKPEYG